MCASGGRPKNPLKNARWRVVGKESVIVQPVISPSLGTRNGRLPSALRIWKPVTLPTARQGDSGQDASGLCGVLPRMMVVRLAAAPAPGGLLISPAHTHTAATAVAAARAPRRSAIPAAPILDFDIRKLLSKLTVPPSPASLVLRVSEGPERCVASGPPRSEFGRRRRNGEPLESPRSGRSRGPPRRGRGR